jgi:hypothetical protein
VPGPGGDDRGVAGRETTPLCALDAAAGAETTCPGAACPFWEPGRSERGGRCAFAGLDVEGDAELAAWLLEIRRRLAAASPSEADPALHLFHHLLNDSAE